MLENADDASMVADVIIRAISDANPNIKYPAGSSAKWLSIFRRFAPSFLIDRAVRKELEL